MGYRRPVSGVPRLSLLAAAALSPWRPLPVSKHQRWQDGARAEKQQANVSRHLPHPHPPLFVARGGTRGRVVQATAAAIAALSVRAAALHLPRRRHRPCPQRARRRRQNLQEDDASDPRLLLFPCSAATIRFKAEDRDKSSEQAANDEAACGQSLQRKKLDGGAHTERYSLKGGGRRC